RAGFGHESRAREPIGPVDVHRARAADAFAARAAERQRRIDVVLDPDQNVEDRRAAILEIDAIGIEARISAGLRIVTVDLERFYSLGTGRRRPRSAALDP